MLKYAIVVGLVLATPLSVLSESHTEDTGIAKVCVVDPDGMPIIEFEIHLLKISKIMGQKADQPGPLNIYPVETGTLVTDKVIVKNKWGKTEFMNLQPGHYQVSVGADGYSMKYPEWRFSQVILERKDVLRVHPNSRIEENEKFRSVWMLTHHFDIVAGKTTDVQIIMISTWTLHGSVAFYSDTSLSEAKRKEQFSHVQCRYAGPEGNAPFYLDENGGFAIRGSGKGILKLSIGKPIGASDEVPWEYVVSIQVDPHDTYILPEVLIKQLLEENKSNKPDAGDGK